jgi:hypothetical protein
MKRPIYSRAELRPQMKFPFVRVIRFGQTINSSDRMSVIFGDFNGWISGHYAITALRCHQLFMRSTCKRKRSKWGNATARVLRQARRVNAAFTI